jgi:two-component system response regulator (stage 0 sporulation protein F)
MTLDKANQQESHELVCGPLDGTRPRILLAEDDEEMRSLLFQCLGEAGYEVVALCDGLELMEHLASYLGPGSRVRVDLIVSDIRMPWVNGLEVLRAVGRYIGYPRMILITAFGDEEIRAEARRMGAAALMDKPFDVEELLARVREIIPGRRVSGS